MEKIKAIKGTHDILPGEMFKWYHMEDTVRKICGNFGFEEIRIPVFEYTDLFARGVGDTTDVVQKEMYTFEDKGGRFMALRPEGTAGVVRSVLEHSLLTGVLPLKLFYLITCYRNENPQAGRYREFRQFGTEVFGSSDPKIDAEVISLAVSLIRAVGLRHYKVHLNSIGCPNCRNRYNETLKAFLRERRDGLCHTCQDRLERNPMRVLDCKSPECQKLVTDAPVLRDFLCDECKEHFEMLQDTLREMGIEFVLNDKIVRGLDYYTKTVFEIKSEHLGAQSTICGGGRYDGLVEQLGGKPTPGIGFAAGLERLLMCIEAEQAFLPQPQHPQLFVAYLGERANQYASKLVYNLRGEGISCQRDYMGRSLKAQMKYADKLGAEFTVVLGDDELDSGEAALRRMADGQEEKVRLENMAKELRRIAQDINTGGTK